VLLVSVLAVGSSSSTDQLLPEDTAYEMITEYRDNYPPPNLPYAYDALEPFVNEATLKVHHQGHHRAYCTKMNAALKEWRKQDPESQLAKSSLYDIMRNLSSVPEPWRTAIRNNGGGFINHIFYFVTMRNKVYTAPMGELAKQVNATFGGYERFMEEFGEAARNLFGSGYVWLVEDEERNISIINTANQYWMYGSTPTTFST
jgi:Fe-Mn family superoxide dismutase